VIPACFEGDGAPPTSAESQSATPGATDLTIRTTWRTAVHTSRQTFHLGCDPPSGDVGMSPALACPRLVGDAADFFGEPATEIASLGGGGTVVITGLHGGERIHLAYHIGQYHQGAAWLGIVEGHSIHGERTRPTVGG
jgi:hypothetical protein